MKKSILAFTTSLILILLLMQPAVAQEHSGHNHESESTERFEDVPEEFRTNLTRVVEAYLNGKDTFLKSDLDATHSEFESFKNRLAEIGQHGLSGVGHMAWMESYNQLTEQVSVLLNSDDIESSRHAFRSLSTELADAVKKFGVEGVVYHQYCPMALDSDGAAWLSRNEQIQNPYTPDTMPGCGEVIDSIES
jgi:Cu(I)/Ag(I) efflux system membrane fusion protein